MKRLTVMSLFSILGVNAFALTTNVSTVAELEAVLEYMNKDGQYAKSGHVVKLAAGTYDVTGLAVKYWNPSSGLKDSDAHLGISKFTLQGATDAPRDTVLYATDSTRILYSYAGFVRGVTLSNAVITADGGAVGNINASSVYTNVIVTCCKARNGGASVSGTWRDCMFIGNVATDNGGALYGSSTVAEKCRFENNVGKCGGGSYAIKSYGCIYVGNRAQRGGGAGNSLLSECFLFENHAEELGGGAYGSAKTAAVALDCIISNNWAGTSGGGVYCGSNVASRICMNVVEGTLGGGVPNGGGVGGDAFVMNCCIDGNAIFGLGENFKGGGIYGSTVIGCNICNNFSKTLGSAAANSMLISCVVSNNVSGANGAAVRDMIGVRDTDFYGASIDLRSWMVGCRVMGYTNGNVLAVGENAYTNGWFSGPNRVFNSYCAVTNCLIAYNRCYGIISSTKEYNSSFSSCTFADNHVEYLATGFADDENSVLTFDNCLVAKNYTQDGAGNCNMRTLYGNVKWSNTLVGSVDCAVSYNYPMYNMITNANPRFVGEALDEEHPHALLHASPARGKGEVKGWMVNASDVRGDAYPRIRDNKVDMGCYQCWLDPVGLMLIVR